MGEKNYKKTYEWNLNEVQEKSFLDAENKDVQNNKTDVERSIICQMIEQNWKLLLSVNWVVRMPIIVLHVNVMLHMLWNWLLLRGIITNNVQLLKLGPGPTAA